MEKISFIDPVDNEQVEFYVIDSVKLGGADYILVTEEDTEEDCDCYIMKAIEDGEEMTYDMVEDDNELAAVAKLFAEQLDDVDIV